MVVWLVFDKLGALEEIFRSEEKALEYVGDDDNYCIESWVVKT